MWPRRLQSSVRKGFAFLLAAALATGLLSAALPARAADPGNGVTIAVLDTGVDGMYQPQLAGRVDRMSFYQPTVPIPPIPGLPDPTSAQPDPDGHGTAVASVAAAKDFGVAPGASILDLQVSARYTNGALDPPAEQAAVRAMDWLLQHHGGNGSAGPRTALHKSPYVLTVGGNAAPCPGALPAAAVLKPDLWAPSDNVKAAKPGNPLMPGTVGTASGTAMAAAAVAGAAARMWQTHPALPVDALQAILRDTAAGAAAPDSCIGFGALDATAATLAAEHWTDPVPPGTPASANSPAPVAAVVAVLLLGLALRRRA